MKRLIFIFLLISFGSFAQTKPSEKYLTKLFKKSIEQKKRNKISIPSNEWIINNLNDDYYKFDTLKVYNKNRNRFCEYVGWTFYRKDSFVLSKAHHCNEPARNSVSKNEDWYKVKFRESEKNTILELYNSEKLISEFEVLAVSENDSEIEITLLRIK
jgi:hypothetical protein